MRITFLVKKRPHYKKWAYCNSIYDYGLRQETLY